MNENHYIAAVIHREDWNTSHSFIGHVAPVEVAVSYYIYIYIY